MPCWGRNMIFSFLRKGNDLVELFRQVVLDGFCWSPPPLWWQVGSSLLSPFRSFQRIGTVQHLRDCWLLFPKLYPTLSSSERRMHPKQLLWAFWLVHDIYKDGFELVWTQQFRTSKYWYRNLHWLDLFPGWKQSCPSLNQLYNHRSCRPSLQVDENIIRPTSGGSWDFNRKVRCYLVQISQVSCLRETLWEDHRRKFFPSNLLFYHSAAFHISCAIRLDKKVRNFLQCTLYTMIYDDDMVLSTCFHSYLGR